MWKILLNRNSINFKIQSVISLAHPEIISSPLSSPWSPDTNPATSAVSPPHSSLFFIMIFSPQQLSMSSLGQISKTLFLLASILVISSSTLVTFYVDHEVEQPLDFVDINLIVKADGESLEGAIEEAAEKIANIKSLVEQYCKGYTPREKQEKECKDLVEASAYSIKPQYEVLKKKELFSGFVVAHEVTINVKESDAFGQLVDDIMKVGVNKVNTLEWKPKEELDGEQFAVEEGVDQAKAICKKLGSSLAKIISVEQVTDFGEEPEEPEGEQEEDEQQEEEEQPLNLKEGIVYYKFVVQCHRKNAK